MVVSRCIRLTVSSVVFFLCLPFTYSQAEVNGSSADILTDVRPMGEWVEFRKARYGGSPILLHLRSGYERAVVMPEPIRLLDETQTLPGCAVEIDTDVVGFFPTRNFTRQPIRFVGLQSGTVYELRVRASPQGIRQPLQITR